MARDARFDGLFFTAVKTTKIYCRPICPVNQPQEKNVHYYRTAVEAAKAGYRPCLRCRPDSAPHSFVWQGTQTSFQRALRLINQGALQQASVDDLADRLGITGRYLRKLFSQYLGTSPKHYALYQQCLFAKQLLHQSDLPITQIAFAAGFKSIRRFNDAFKKNMALSPSKIRDRKSGLAAHTLKLKLHYRPPFAWQHSHKFLKSRQIPGLEWSDDHSYSRTIDYKGTQGFFTVEPQAAENFLLLTVHLNDTQNLHIITQKIRHIFDLDAPVAQIDDQISRIFSSHLDYLYGLRVPGIWGLFEAGIRAILGQQVSVKAAHNLVTLFVDNLGETAEITGLIGKKYFPKPEAVHEHPLGFLKMPAARKETIRQLAKYFLQQDKPENIDQWAKIKGIGQWTIDYVKMRGGQNPDIWLDGDAGIKNALKQCPQPLPVDAAAPWRSYLTFQMWNQL